MTSLESSPRSQQRDSGSIRCAAVRSARRGTTAVELAFVSIPIFLLTFGSIELGRGLMAVQALEEAARCGCRTAVVQGATKNGVKDQVTHIMEIAGITSHHTEIQPSKLDKVPQWDPVIVTVTTDIEDFSWLPVPEFLAGTTFTATCVLPREGDPDAD